MSKRQRADQALVELGLAESRNKAQAAIMAGQVWVGERRIDKPGQQLGTDDIAKLEIRRANDGYVGRGAQKLLPVLERTGIDASGRVCIDIGASTGGFTEVLLTQGASRVWAVDVGYGQLHPRLRDDPRVVVRERCNFRHWDDPDAPAFDLAVMDVSFISVRKLLDPLARSLRPGGDALILVKPQFELGRDRVPRKGVVRDPALIDEAVQLVIDAAGAAFEIRERYAAGVAGRKGNQEQFLW
ncbi:MAG: TlyA family RNA methyltransferase, partial [Candidatus Dadabacteria bacterium]